MKEKTKKKLRQNEILLLHLRQKQLKEGGYITTKSISYKIFRWAFFVCIIACTILNLFYILGTARQMEAHLANMGDIAPHQKIEIERLRTTIPIISVSAFFLFLSEVALWFKKPLLQFVFCFGSSAVIIARISGEIYDKTSNALMNNHIIPLALLCFFCLVSSVLYIRQLYKDKKEIQKLSEVIYQKYSALATDITEEQWDTILTEYDPYETKHKKDRLKISKKITEKAETQNPDF